MEGFFRAWSCRVTLLGMGIAVWSVERAMANKHKRAIRADVQKIFDGIMIQRDEILRAFISQYGCKPDEVEQVVKQSGAEITYSVRKKTNDTNPV